MKKLAKLAYVERSELPLERMRRRLARQAAATYHSAYSRRPKAKAYRKAYNARPDVKARKKIYDQRPEVRAYQKIYQKTYYIAHKAEYVARYNVHRKKLKL